MTEDPDASTDRARAFEPLIEFFNRLLVSEGFSARAVAWRDEDFQRFRFASVAPVFEHERGGFSVYDVGCGLGHMYEFLAEHYPLASYTGCDINPRMVAGAKARNQALATRVEQRDIVASPPSATADYVVASGSFNLRMTSSDADWWQIVRSVLRAMYAIARKGIAANFLTTLVDWQRPVAYHQDPARALEFAQAELSRYAEIRHSYYPWEFALLVYREAKPLRYAP